MPNRFTTNKATTTQSFRAASTSEANLALVQASGPNNSNKFTNLAYKSIKSFCSKVHEKITTIGNSDGQSVDEEERDKRICFFCGSSTYKKLISIKKRISKLICTFNE